MKLKHIIYRSSATLKYVDLEEILNVARQHNPSVGITGVLITHSQGFFQYVEGPEECIDNLYERIKNDIRHNNVTTLSIEETSERLYKDWSMGYLCLSDKSEIESLQGNDFKSSHFHEVVESLLPLVL